MWEKERGYILSIDPASLKCGASLRHNGQLIGWAKIDGGKKSTPMSEKMRRQAAQIDLFLNEHIPEGEFVHTVVFELTDNMVLNVSMGPWFSAAQVRVPIIKKTHYIRPSVWKKWAQAQGAEPPSARIKGLKALREIGWDFNTYPIDCDDVADSVLIYMAWAARG